jgi:hypothetical protein
MSLFAFGGRLRADTPVRQRCPPHEQVPLRPLPLGIAFRRQPNREGYAAKGDRLAETCARLSATGRSGTIK